jgi:hypothetical protein
MAAARTSASALANVACVRPVRNMCDAPEVAYALAVARPIPRLDPRTKTVNGEGSFTEEGSVGPEATGCKGGHQLMVGFLDARDMIDN